MSAPGGHHGPVGAACRPARRRSYGTRRGMTFLEVVFASAMLGIVVASLFGALNFVIASEIREQRRLGAAELANRLVLNFLDSPSGMPDPAKLIEYGPPETPLKYRWEYREEPVRVVEAMSDQRDRKRESTLNNNRFRQVTVRVWLSEYSGGSRMPEPSTPSVTVSRMLDPVAPRNPDSYMAMINNPADRERLIRTFMGVAATASPQATGQAAAQGTAAAGRATGRRPAGTVTRGSRASGRASDSIAPRDAMSYGPERRRRPVGQQEDRR